MFKYSISTLLLISLIPFSTSATRELKGLRGTVCVTKVTQNETTGLIEDVTLAIEDGCDFKLKTEGQPARQEIKVEILRKDITETYNRLGIISTPASQIAADEYILEFDVQSKCPFKKVPSICISPETNIESLTRIADEAALLSSLFAVQRVSFDTFHIRMYLTIVGSDFAGFEPHKIIGNFLKDFLEGTPENKPFCIHFIAADKPCKRNNH